MKAKVTGSIIPPRGTPGANGAYLVDLELEVVDDSTVAMMRFFTEQLEDAGIDPEFVQAVKDAVKIVKANV